MLPRRIAATLGVAVGFAFVAAAPAAAAETIGQAPPIEGGLGDCGPAYTVQTSNATGPGYVVPPPGGRGRHNFRVRSTDAAGNRDLTAAKFAWTVTE